MAKNKLDSVSVKTVLDNRGGPRHRRLGALGKSNSSTNGPATFSVRVSISTYQRGARKQVITPHGEAAWKPRETRIDDTLIKALARAHRWKRMIETGEFGSMTELAAAEKVTESYLCRILRLNLLSPRVVEAALDGTPYAVPQLQQLVRPFPIEWGEQEAALLSPTGQ